MLLLLRNRWALPCSSVVLAAFKVIQEPVPALGEWAFTSDCKATLALAPASRVLAVTVGRKAILGPVSVWRVPAVMVDHRSIRNIRRVSDLAAVDLPVLVAVDRWLARAALL